MVEKSYGPAVLWIDGGKESNLAKKLCDAANVKYDLVDLRNFQSTDVIAPSLFHSIQTRRFVGVEEIKDYITRVHSCFPTSN